MSRCGSYGAVRSAKPQACCPNRGRWAAVVVLTRRCQAVPGRGVYMEGVYSMARRRPTDLRRGTSVEKQFEWFAHAASQPAQCDSWEIKTELTCDVLFGLLASGVAVMFGSARDGGALSVTIYDGDSKQRVWIDDAIEWEDLMLALNTRIQARKKGLAEIQLRAVGD